MFHAKLEAFKAQLFSGSAWGPSTVAIDPATGHAKFKYGIMSATGSGYLIDVIEYQKRGLPHAHIVLRFAVPPAGYTATPAPDDLTPWVDEFILAEKPTEENLRRFGMIVDEVYYADSVIVAAACGGGVNEHGAGKAARSTSNTGIADARAWLNRSKTEFLQRARDEPNSDKVTDEERDGSWLAHINAPAPETRSVVHPQALAKYANMGYGDDVSADDFVVHMRKLVLDRSDPLNPLYGNGPHEHGPHPNKREACCTSRASGHCKKMKDNVTCASRYPFMPNAETNIGPNGFITYRRGEGDEFIVPYNPWMLLYFECHMNVECAASSNCIAYL